MQKTSRYTNDIICRSLNEAADAKLHECVQADGHYLKPKDFHICMSVATDMKVRAGTIGRCQNNINPSEFCESIMPKVSPIGAQILAEIEQRISLQCNPDQRKQLFDQHSSILRKHVRVPGMSFND